MAFTEVIQVTLNDGVTTAQFLAANKVIEEGYVSQQKGFISRETAISAENEVMIVVHWENDADIDASQAGFGNAEGVETFFGVMDQSTMKISRYEVQKTG